MHFISDNLEHYVAQHSENEPQLLIDLDKETHQKILNPRMLSGHFQGRFLSILSKIIRPKAILEIGTYTGYAALCLAEGLEKSGTLDTIELNEELVWIQNKYFGLSQFSHQITNHLGNALEIIPTLNKKFDLVFIDADKENYIRYFHLIMPMMNSGGLILSDNVLWSGKILEAVKPNDKSTNVLLEFNKLMKKIGRAHV